MKNRIKLYIKIIILCLCTTLACTPWDDYKKYLEEGELIYPQKPDSLKIFPGRNRMLLEWQIVDPKVTFCEIIYSGPESQGSVKVPIDFKDKFENDTVRVIIENLIEGYLLFTVTSYDKLGNASLPVGVEDFAYGEIYEKSLLNRILKSMTLAQNRLDITWYNADESEVGIELSYKNTSGVTKNIFIPNSITVSTLEGFDVEHPFSYRTLYLPAPMAIDTFYSPIVEKYFVSP